MVFAVVPCLGRAASVQPHFLRDSAALHDASGLLGGVGKLHVSHDRRYLQCPGRPNVVDGNGLARPPHKGWPWKRITGVWFRFEIFAMVLW
jgi:hypothetical protein